MNHPYLMLALGLSSLNPMTDKATEPQAIHRCTVKSGKSTALGLGTTPNGALLLASEVCLSKAGTAEQCAWDKVKCEPVQKAAAPKMVSSFANAHPELAERITVKSGHACQIGQGLSNYVAVKGDLKSARAEVQNECLQNDPFGDLCKPERIRCINLADNTLPVDVIQKRNIAVKEASDDQI